MTEFSLENGKKYLISEELIIDSNPEIFSTLKKPQLDYASDGYVLPKCEKELMYFNPEVVLFNPEIPPNTGTIGRLCAAMCTRLHLIEPLGYELSDRTLRRAGLDYWEFLHLTIHKSWEDFLQKRGTRRLVFIETGGTQTPENFNFLPGDILIFGSETKGVPRAIIEKTLAELNSHLVTIPMFNRGVRSINLSNTVSIGLYMAIAQIHNKPTI